MEILLYLPVNPAQCRACAFCQDGHPGCTPPSALQPRALWWWLSKQNPCYARGMWLYEKSCKSVSDSHRAEFKAPRSQQVPFSCLQWVWIRSVLLSHLNVSTLVWCTLYSNNMEGTILVLLQNTEQILQSSFISFERRKSPITFAQICFSAFECAGGE